MFPYSDKTHISKDYVITLDFNTIRNSEYNGFKFTVADVEKFFEHIKFASQKTFVYFSPDFLQTEFTFEDVYGQIEGIYFHKNVIKVEIKVLDTPRGILLKSLIDAKLFIANTKFFISVTHIDGSELKYHNLYPSLKSYRYSDIGHFEGEITP